MSLINSVYSLNNSEHWYTFSVRIIRISIEKSLCLISPSNIIMELFAPPMFLASTISIETFNKDTEDVSCWLFWGGGGCIGKYSMYQSWILAGIGIIISDVWWSNNLIWMISDRDWVLSIFIVPTNIICLVLVLWIDSKLAHLFFLHILNLSYSFWIRFIGIITAVIQWFYRRLFWNLSLRNIILTLEHIHTGQ